MSALYAKINSDWNENFIGYSALAIIFTTCLGSMGVYTIMMHGNSLPQMLQLFLVVVGCSAHNASILTVQKPSLVLKLLILSVLISTVMIVANLMY